MAKLVTNNLLKGNAREYKISDGSHVIVSRAYTPDHGDEVMIFLSDGNGKVTDWSELYCARAKWGDDMSDEAALKSIGEEIEPL
jgi:hypothetical protein